ncbi:hypothetical protein WJR50_10015 [Catalinimonas sp. 4WD22]|uniref:hypothetical protein n=1 Tax=Catalinimonas locisalis TaxID=3133978 RepID=UPI003100F291
MFKLALFGIFILCSFPLSAQIEPDKIIDSTSTKGVSYAILSIRYVSDAVFMGRKDSVAAPYLIPQLSYFHRTGLYVSGSFSYLTAEDERRIDLYLLSAGYQLQKSSWSAGLAVTQYFFNDQSYTIKSQFNTDLSAYLGYDLYVLEVYVDGSLYFTANESPDLILGTELSRTFYALERRLQLTPKVYLNMGTQYYYEAYYQNVRQQRRGNQNGKGHGSGNPNSSVASIEETSSFKLQDIEFSIPLRYTIGSFRFSFIPTLAIPFGEITITEGQETINEKFENTFFWSVGVGYLF